MAETGSDRTHSVTFDDLRANYSTDQDIFVAYTLGKDVEPTSRDWVGLYKSDWTSAKQYLAFEWAPNKPRDARFSSVRSVLFRAKYLHVPPNADQTYEFMYVTKQDAILGRSALFRIYDEVTSEDDTNLECVDRDIDGAGSMTVIRTRPEKHKGLLESFELIRDSEPNVLEMNATLKELYLDQSPLSGGLSTTPTEEFDLLRLLDVLDQSNDAGVVVGGASGADTKDPVAGAYLNLNAALPINESSVQATAENDPPKLLPIYNVASQNTTLRPLPFFFPSRRGIHEQVGECRRCKERKARTKQLQQKMLSAKLDAQAIKQNLKTTQQELATKKDVMDEMSSQLKSLIHENTSLTNTNNTLVESVKSVSDFKTEKSRLSRKVDSLNATVESLMANSDSLVAEKDLVNQQLTLELKKSQDLKQDNEELCREISKVKCRECELQLYLDDVMYTLSLQGYTTLINTKGDVVDLTKANGHVIELRGNELNRTTTCADDKHEEIIHLHAQMLEDYRRNCDELSHELHSWKSNVTTKDHKLSELLLQLSEENGKVLGLRSEISGLQIKLKDATEKEELTKREMLDMKKEKSMLLREHDEEICNLNLKVKSLHDNLAACRTGNRAISVSPQRQMKSKGNQTARVSTAEKTVSVHYGCDAAPTQACAAQSPLCCGASCTPPLCVSGGRPKSKTESRKGSARKFARETPFKATKQLNTQETKYGLQSSAQKFFAQFEAQTPIYTVQSLVEAEGRSTSQDTDSIYGAGVSRHIVTKQQKGPGSAVRTSNVAREVSRQTSQHTSPRSQTPVTMHTDPGNQQPEPYTVVKYRVPHGAKSKKPLRSVEIINGTCSRCGLVFPPGTAKYRMDKHTYMHAKYGY